ncbi:Hypothetical Protein FCC1311_102222 [Hondaea fermentalgiana]|uniref:Uncharacterized protein n=1 Tax=Hondaea fermentalgiana TaxID=2315210 RepID=A0A2R5GUJ8_9STRA|nr:Hypothetical Protein FCC1311_102222 [Hondaea fermentalgiana]|eukprot:GBG33999.1 Hypothetical Protein FCC1311_102222 [Hondaea fermentalgiana]
MDRMLAAHMNALVAIAAETKIEVELELEAVVEGKGPEDTRRKMRRRRSLQHVDKTRRADQTCSNAVTNVFLEMRPILSNSEELVCDLS